MNASRHFDRTPEPILPFRVDVCAQNVPKSHITQRTRSPSPEQKKTHYSPETCETRMRPHSYLINAHTLGSLEAQKVIQMIKKNKNEIGTQFCETTEINLIEKQPKYDSLLQNVKDFEEEFSEKLLYVKDLDNEGGINKYRPAMESSKLQISIQNIHKEPCYQDIIPDSPLTEPKCGSSVKSTIQNNVGIQYNSKFTIDIPETQRCIQVQFPEKDIINQKLNKIQSLTCSQYHASEEVLEERNYSQVSLKNDIKYHNISSTSVTESAGKLKYILKKLIHNKRNRHANIWKKYINELKTRHRAHNRAQSTNETYYCSDHDSIPISPLSLPIRVQSTFVLDDLSSRGISSYGTSSKHKKRYEMNPLQYASPIPDVGDDKYDYFSRRNKIIPQQPLEFGEPRINPFCYPSLLSNSMNLEDVAKPKMRKLCRDINITPLTPEKKYEFSFRPQTEQSLYNHNDFNTEYLNRWLERPLIKGKNRFSPNSETSNRYNNSYLDNGNLQAVPEEICVISKNSKTKRSQSSHNDVNTKTENCKNSKSSLSAIENKLDTLIESIHALISEVKQSRSQNNKTVDKRCILPPLTKFNCIRYLKFNENIIKSKSDPVKISAGDRLLRSVGEMILGQSDINVHGIISPNVNKGCDIQVVVTSKTRTKSTNTTAELMFESPSYPKEVFVTGKVKEKLTRHHYVKCDKYPHALQLTVDFLVKDNPKEHLPKMKKCDTKPLPSNTICSCVNTEPLTLGQISQEAIKSVWSVVPLFEYFWSLLPLPSFCTPTTYICEICKQSFDSAFELSEHIRVHYANEKDCAICRELTSNGDKRTIRAVVRLPKVFSCRHCGQTFCRAYARQLHEACCKQNHDGGKRSLVVLS